MVNFTTVACRVSSWLKWHKNYKNRLRLAKVIVKNKMSRFFMVHCVYTNLTKFPGDILGVRKWISYTSRLGKLIVFITPCECVHLVTRSHFRSRDEDGGDTIRFAVAKNPMLHANLMFFYNRSYRRLKFYIAGIRISDLLFLWPWLWPSNFHIWAWPVFPVVQIWTSYAEAFESYCLTDSHDRNYFRGCSVTQ